MPRPGKKPKALTTHLLTLREKVFIREYMVDLNGAQAAIRCGYKAKNARVTAAKILERSRVQREIERLERERLERLDISGRDVIKELARIGLSDIRKCFDSDTGEMLPITEIDENTARAISSVEITETEMNFDNGGSSTRVNKKLRLWDKGSSLNTLAKHFNLVRSSVEVTGKDGGPVQIKDTTIPFDRLSTKLKRMVLEELDGLEGLDEGGGVNTKDQGDGHPQLQKRTDKTK